MPTESALTRCPNQDPAAIGGDEAIPWVKRGICGKVVNAMGATVRGSRNIIHSRFEPLGTASLLCSV